ILSTLTPAAGANQSTGPQSTRFVYGLPGQLRFQISGTGIVTEQRYDTAGQKTAEIHFTNVSYPVAGLGTTGLLSLGQLQSWSTSQIQSNTT
ncbi:hypothetical protein ACO0LF_31885, partial [Undibacterium sp. Di27W]|uniref:hypothetical protein n=1 Tax=Undibacterium sp. Di27W TaxID=3413036 RepID=UPI003BF2BC94